MMFANDCWNRLVGVAEQELPLRICISSYGFYTAFQNWPGPSDRPPYEKMNPLQRLLHWMDRTQEKSGLFFTCPPDGIERLSREVLLVAELFPNILFRLSPRNHAKIVWFEYEERNRIWTGSCNATTSGSSGFYDSLAEILGEEDLDRHQELLVAIMSESKRL